ncbi:hypothetical protein PQ455_00905 [Sphingomonas naphthae]|uniref:Nucleotidyltransferase family protein n=1 Tax=Sphingomonas naphthae TaxID=1813468 RepID=A0ABY7TKS0_9SPHN|nr:hypothetical protein [Sphingomonas naphthae]WCT73822.1 hypothetical protein PQ455_00905 [Sphingomonas naphthae]
MTLPADLRATLAQVAAAMAEARDPWWIIGSAAVALHGATTTIADVDVLTSARDAHAFLTQTGGAAVEAATDPHFRSALFGRWHGPPLPVEVMGDLHLNEGGWRMVELKTRQSMEVAGATLFIPSREELIALLHRFGRPKDFARAALLER